jgi:hypothetical protein
MTEILRERLFQSRKSERPTPADAEQALPSAPPDQELARRRFVALAGAAFFGLALKMTFPQIASATCTPFPCDGPRCCDCCVWGPGCTCCNGLNHGVWPNACWVTCAPDCYQYKCCDFNQYGGICICKLFLGTTCC